MPCEHNQSVKCNCTYPCPRHGKCCECIAYHNRSGELPACVFSKEAEATYDRSLSQLNKDRGR